MLPVVYTVTNTKLPVYFAPVTQRYRVRKKIPHKDNSILFALAESAQSRNEIRGAECASGDNHVGRKSSQSLNALDDTPV